MPEATPSANGQQARNTEGKPTPGASTVTLALSPQDAEKMYLAEANGKIRFSLRAYGDGEQKPVDYVNQAGPGSAKPAEPVPALDEVLRTARHPQKGWEAKLARNLEVVVVDPEVNSRADTNRALSLGALHGLR